MRQAACCHWPSTTAREELGWGQRPVRPLSSPPRRPRCAGMKRKARWEHARDAMLGSRPQWAPRRLGSSAARTRTSGSGGSASGRLAASQTRAARPCGRCCARDPARVVRSGNRMCRSSGDAQAGLWQHCWRAARRGGGAAASSSLRRHRLLQAGLSSVGAGHAGGVGPAARSCHLPRGLPAWLLILLLHVPAERVERAQWCSVSPTAGGTAMPPRATPSGL